jgi:Tol biopolymer transport system component
MGVRHNHWNMDEQMTTTPLKERLMKGVHLLVATGVAAAACGTDSTHTRYGSAAAQTASSNAGLADAMQRRIWTAPHGDFSTMWPSFSPDGSTLIFCEFHGGSRPGELQALDIATGLQRRLTRMDREYCASQQVISRDGSRVAFAWNSAASSSGGIRIVGMDGAGLRDVRANPEDTWIDLKDWSPDGRHLLGVRKTPWWAPVAFRATDLVVLSESGELRAIRTWDWSAVREAYFAPDGQLIAYSALVRDGEVDVDIYTAGADGRSEIRLTSDGRFKTLLGWSPAGDALFYSTPGAGFSESVWRLPVSGGRRAGSPVLVRADIAGFDPIGMSGGRIYYSLRPRNAAQVLQLAIDATGGTASGDPETLSTPRRGEAGSSAWSPDGSRLAYVFSGHGLPQTIIVRSMVTGEEQEVLHGLSRTHHLHWLPDGRTLLMYGERQGVTGTFEFDLRSGQIQHLLPWPAVPSPDGAMLYGFRGEPEQPVSLIAHDRRTGAERVLVSGLPTHMSRPSWISLAVSPAGDMLAYLLQESGGTINVVPLDGRGPWIAHTDNRDAYVMPEGGIAWTPNGEHIVFGFSGQNTLVDRRAVAGTRGIAAVPARGGAAQTLFSSSTMTNYITNLRVHHDGRRVTFRGDPGTSGSTVELWVLEPDPSR